jgi:ElaB/YqjD/DUF883 family membrane-anchored ribosome-binding protein
MAMDLGERRTKATQRSVERERTALAARVGPRVAAFDARARRSLRERPLVAIGAAAALGWLLGRAFGPRR